MNTGNGREASTRRPGAGKNRWRGKLKNLSELSELASEVRNGGGSLVLAHGTFDLLHIGHLRHLNRARQEGTVLAVTITGDAFVNKGPGRPVFSESMRAEMLAELECVDWVAVNQGLTAVNVIETVKPNVFAKGTDYANPADDITGGIVEERRAVESYGGRLHLTDDVTYSSSNLINRHLSVLNPELDEFLKRLRETSLMEDLFNLIESVKQLKVLVVGDTIIDEYNYVSAMNKTPKEQIIATHFSGSEIFAGGVIAAANHVSNFCTNVDVITLLGERDPYEKLIRKSLSGEAKLFPFFRSGAPTTRKVRYIDQSYLRKMFEVYHMDDSLAGPQTEESIMGLLREKIRDYDLVIVTDFGHGLITQNLIEVLTKHASFLAVNAQSNSANMGFNLITKYPRADYVCVDLPEARLAVNDRTSDIELITGQILPSHVDCRNIIVTSGKNGCCGYKDREPLAKIPAFTTDAVDTVGAGDAFFAVSAPMAAIGATIEQVAFIGNVAGALKVNIVGHRNAVEKVALLKAIQALLK